MARVVAVDGALLQRVLATMAPGPCRGLSPAAVATFNAAQTRTAWAIQHRRHLALVESDDVLASAEVYDLHGRLDGQPLAICGIAPLSNRDATDGDPVAAAELIEHLLDDAVRRDADLALLFHLPTSPPLDAHGFEVLPTASVDLTVSESLRHGAPMVLVRGGEKRDLDAIAAMGRARTIDCRFHLDRDVDFIAHAITRTRLLAGLAPPGVRRLEFVIAEEGITAAAYLVMTIVDNAWTIEECGDRDITGARVGALLQALIAREPAESRPAIRGWLPPGFVPPQVSVAAATMASPTVLVRALSSRVQGVQWSPGGVLYWLNDVL